MNQDYCPACGRLIAQTKRGALWTHKERRGSARHCPGSGANPSLDQ